MAKKSPPKPQHAKLVNRVVDKKSDAALLSQCAVVIYAALRQATLNDYEQARPPKEDLMKEAVKDAKELLKLCGAQ